MASLLGCFNERSFPVGRAELIRIAPSASQLPPRDWLVQAHGQLQQLLPGENRPTLLTGDLTTPAGQPVDVFKIYHSRFEDMDSLLVNAVGITHTAQVASRGLGLDQPLPDWPGFADLTITVDESLRLSGRIGWAVDEAGQRIDAPCIVILPGLFGGNAVWRTRDLAVGLRTCGFHVLALELRACGQTEKNFPQYYTTWGLLESNDLLRVSKWLEEQPQVQSTGLVATCWGSNIALATVWAEGRPADDPKVPVKVAPHVPRATDRPAFTAGVLLFSPALNYEEMSVALEKPQSALRAPILKAFQDVVRERKKLKNHQPIDGRLETLVGAEVRQYPFFNYPGSDWDARQYMRFRTFRDKPYDDKLQHTRMPLLIVHAYNDPMVPSQCIADLLAATHNPNVAAVILPGGGHVGFPAYSKEYYFSLIVNFFDPATRPQACKITAD